MECVVFVKIYRLHYVLHKLQIGAVVNFDRILRHFGLVTGVFLLSGELSHIFPQKQHSVKGSSNLTINDKG